MWHIHDYRKKFSQFWLVYCGGAMLTFRGYNSIGLASNVAKGCRYIGAIAARHVSFAFCGKKFVKLQPTAENAWIF
jgi:hypothetical protein